MITAVDESTFDGTVDREKLVLPPGRMIILPTPAPGKNICGTARVEEREERNSFSQPGQASIFEETEPQKKQNVRRWFPYRLHFETC